MLLVDETGISQSIARTEESLPVPERPQAGEDAYLVHELVQSSTVPVVKL